MLLRTNENLLPELLSVLVLKRFVCVPEVVHPTLLATTA